MACYEFNLTREISVERALRYICEITGGEVTENYGQVNDDTIWTGHKLNGCRAERVFQFNPHVGEIISLEKLKMTNRITLHTTLKSKEIDKQKVQIALESLAEEAV